MISVGCEVWWVVDGFTDGTAEDEGVRGGKVVRVAGKAAFALSERGGLLGGDDELALSADGR